MENIFLEINPGTLKENNWYILNINIKIFLFGNIDEWIHK